MACRHYPLIGFRLHRSAPSMSGLCHFSLFVFHRRAPTGDAATSWAKLQLQGPLFKARACTPKHSVRRGIMYYVILICSSILFDFNVGNSVHTGPHAEAFSKICKHFVTHGCRLGTKCRFLHCTPSQLAEKLSTQQDPAQPQSSPQDTSSSTNANSSNNKPDVMATDSAADDNRS